MELIKYPLTLKLFVSSLYLSELFKKLKNCGFLLAISSKNDLDLVLAALNNDKFLLNEDDFVCIEASYEPKSTQIKK